MTAMLVMWMLAAEPTRLAFVEDDYPAALARARATKVPLFVETWAPWCHTCVFMREHVLNRPELGSHGGHYVFLAINTEQAKNTRFLQKFPISVWPTLLVIDSASETVALKWYGALNVEELDKLLEDGDRAVRMTELAKGSLEAKLARADRLDAQGKPAEAVAAYTEALAAMPANHPRRSRTVESLLTALAADGANKECVRLALDEVPRLPRGPSYAAATYLGFTCLVALDPKDPARISGGDALITFGIDALKIEGLLADDRSGLYETLVGYLAERGDTKRSVELAGNWLEFLEGEAAKANTPEARAAFDPHRVEAAIASGQPQRMVAPLLKSEQELPNDYNAPARLALIYRELGKLDDALAASDRAMKNVYGPRRLRVMETRAAILGSKGDTAAQKQQLQDAVAYAKALPQGQRSEQAIARLEALLSRVK
jgi:tetratricopeptide (TPR) repeat protein